MEFVTDTSVLIAVIAGEPVREALIERTRGANLIAPLTVHWEVGNAFSAMLRRDRVSLADARRAVQLYRRIPLRLVDVDLDAALQVSAQTGLYAYDAYLICCAQSYRAPLLSLDRRLLAAARSPGVAVEEVRA